jgi:hypothetical protein
LMDDFGRKILRPVEAVDETLCSARDSRGVDDLPGGEGAKSADP